MLPFQPNQTTHGKRTSEVSHFMHWTVAFRFGAASQLDQLLSGSLDAFDAA